MTKMEVYRLESSTLNAIRYNGDNSEQVYDFVNMHGGGDYRLHRLAASNAYALVTPEDEYAVINGVVSNGDYVVSLRDGSIFICGIDTFDGFLRECINPSYVAVYPSREKDG